MLTLRMLITHGAVNNVRRCAYIRSIRSIQTKNTKNFCSVFPVSSLRKNFLCIVRLFRFKLFINWALKRLVIYWFFFLSGSYWHDDSSEFTCIVHEMRTEKCRLLSSGVESSSSISSFRIWLTYNAVLGDRQQFELVVTWNSSELTNNSKLQITYIYNVSRKNTDWLGVCCYPLIIKLFSPLFVVGSFIATQFTKLNSRNWRLAKNVIAWHECLLHVATCHLFASRSQSHV